MSMSIVNYSYGNKTYEGFWDDFRAPANAIRSVGLSKPCWGKVKSNGLSIPLNYAVYFNSNNDEYAKIESSANYKFDDTSFAIALLIKPMSSTSDK
jgi:hypothetical protein